MLVAIENLHAYDGEAHILQGVSLTVGAGEVVTLIGRNGAGKTTTLRSLMNLVPPRGGRVAFDGRDLTRLPTHEVALALSHRLYVMDQGRIQFEGTPDALRADPEIQQRFLGV